MNSARSWLVWGVGALAYLIAIVHRTSLGVAGPTAAERFDLQATALSTLGAVQIAVYAAMQVPIGVLLDRLGPRVLIASGAAIMAVGQTIVAFAPDLGIAIVGRMLIGVGDAATFISVIRLQAGWFTGKTAAQLSQFTAGVGQFGQFLSAVPFSWMLFHLGWEPSFGSLAAVGVVGFVLVLCIVFDGPKEGGAPPTGSIDVPTGSWPRLKNSLRRPGTQLGFWTHFTLLSTPNLFALFWGFPMLVESLGHSREFAAGLLSTTVIVGMVMGPALGILTARFPLRRSTLVLGIAALTAAAWIAVLAWPGTPPDWLLIVLVVVLGIAGPGSTIGFDFARTSNPLRMLGSANGIVNVGGFTASFVMMPLIGILLDLQYHWRTEDGEDVGLYDWGSFRLAMLVLLVALAIGAAMVVRLRRRARAQLRAEEGIEIGPTWRAIAARLRRRRQGGVD